MAEPVRVIQFGLGPIGSAVARHVLERDGIELVGAVDIDAAKMGRDAGEVIGAGRHLGFAVTRTLEEALQRCPAEVVLHTTSSYFPLFKGQILDIVQAGLDVVSTSEELSFPWLAHPAEAAEIDQAAKRAGKTVLATGVNPGFLMDALPLFLTAICQRVEHIAVRRVSDASKRRGPFQAKIGCGLTVEEFQTRMAAGRMGHVGLVESAGMIFHALGQELVRFETTVEPIVAQQRVRTDFFDVPAGRVMGLQQVARAYSPQGELVELTFVAALEVATEQDTISIVGTPNLEVTLKGTNGDIATVAIAVNAVRRVLAAPPGLMTMYDLPMVTTW